MRKLWAHVQGANAIQYEVYCVHIESLISMWVDPRLHFFSHAREHTKRFDSD